ncbi:MAG: hypothetical protein Q8932_17190, partial [Bacteroidota bacterium]|nr:hypothetical protein [Bacteroidota bacterium]
MSPIEEFTESEKQKLNWLQKLAANYPDVTATRLLARGYAKPEIRSVRNIKPSIFRRSMYFLLSLTLVTWLSLLITLGDQRTPLAVYLVFVPFFAFGSVSCMLVVFGKKLNYTIRIDASGLMVQGIFTAWGEIVETAIMRQIRSRGQSR